MIKATFPEHSAMLMIGSPGIGMLEFSVSIAKDWMEQDSMVIFVTVDLLPSDLLNVMTSFGVSSEVLGRNLFIIDYHSSLLGSSDAPTSCNGTEIRRVSDLEGIMFNISALAESTKRPVKIIIHSLSTLFLYNQSNVVLKFFQISSSRIRNEFGTAFFTIHEGVHDERTVNHLMAIADGVLELKFDEELNRRMRVRNMRGCVTSSQWIPFEIKQVTSEQSPSVLEWR
ncbi:MAG: ATPase domain-containing protein [Methanomassiliicoccus sp.]|nr:ATPase domain-containing protein [Methanomassiliicoccus sp.]